MNSVKKYRVKTKPVTAMKTYVGQPLYEIRDFMLGCKNIVVSFRDVHEGFTEHIPSSRLPRDLSPGDYIVLSGEGNATFMSPSEFESRYELQVDNRELYYVIQKYGFSVDDAINLLREPKTREILLNPDGVEASYEKADIAGR